MPRALTVLAALLLGAAALTTAVPQAHAEDVRREIRLLTSEGKFANAAEMIGKAPEEVQNDTAFRHKLADLAWRNIKRAEGEHRRAGLIAIAEHYQAVGKVDAANLDAAVGGIEAASQLADLDLEAKQPDDAKAKGAMAVDFGETAVKAGVNDPKLKEALAKAYEARADVSHKVNDIDQIVVDLSRSAELLEQASDGHSKPLDMVSNAARMWMKVARFVHEYIPIEEEHRDEEAAKKAVELAKKACEIEGADKDQYTAHVLALRTLRQVGVEGDFGKPYMEELKPAVFGLKLELPKGKGWKVEKSKEWDFIATRQFEGEDKKVQVMLKVWEHDDGMYGYFFSNLKKLTAERYIIQQEKFKEVSRKIGLHVLGEGPPAEDDGKKKKKKKKRKKKKKKKPKKGEVPPPEVWTFQIVGEPKSKPQAQQLAEFFWSNAREPIAYQLRILDWGTPFGLSDDDMMLFIQSAVGADQWPEKVDDGKKKK